MFFAASTYFRVSRCAGFLAWTLPICELSASYVSVESGGGLMGATQEKAIGNISKDTESANKEADSKVNKEADSKVNKIDRTAPAGSANSLGAESVRDGRPATDDSVVEAIDEEGPEITSGQLP
jgi:hypothetical protein